MSGPSHARPRPRPLPRPLLLFPPLPPPLLQISPRQNTQPPRYTQCATADCSLSFGSAAVTSSTSTSTVWTLSLLISTCPVHAHSLRRMPDHEPSEPARTDGGGSGQSQPTKEGGMPAAARGR
eukprot:878523-Rhodomonas_salina.1